MKKKKAPKRRPGGNKTILAARVSPWLLYRFKRYSKFSGKRPGIILQEALQNYFHRRALVPEEEMSRWLDEYHAEHQD